MSDFLLYASVVILFLVSLLVILVILMQRPSANAGMGSALGGGAAETVFGGESANVLSKLTSTLTVILFVLSFALYLGFVAKEKVTPKALVETPAITPVKTEEPKVAVPVKAEDATPATSVPEAAPSAAPVAPAATK